MNPTLLRGIFYQADGTDGGAPPAEAPATTDNTPESPETKTDEEKFYGKDDEPKPDEGQGGDEPKDEPKEDPSEPKDGDDPEKSDETDDNKKDEADDNPYADLKTEEGFTIGEEALEMFKEEGLSAEGAQKFVDMAQNMKTGILEAIKADRDQTMEAWDKQVDEDESITTEQIDRGSEFLSKHTSEGFVGMLKESGYIRHPEMVKFLISVSGSVSEDSMLGGEGSQKVSRKSDAETFYPNAVN